MQAKKQSEKTKIKQYEQALVQEVTNDFNQRREQRLMLERQWELNRNFIKGNQYCDVNKRGEIVADPKEFFWQNRGVYNHIAPIVESRLSRFARISPTLAVRPKTNDDKDVANASIAEKLLDETLKALDISEVVKKATAWSETCGSAFYKIIWDKNGGSKIADADGCPIYEGEVKVIALSPFEIFPESLCVEKVSEQKSIIHAKVMPVDEVNQIYGVKLKGEAINPFEYSDMEKTAFNKQEQTVINNAVIVIEKFERPSNEFPDGRIITVAGGELLQVDVLPYVNGDKGQRTYPFIKQDCLSIPGSFFGASIVERLIPVQRAFNAVKNRKHEFLNRLSMGIMTVEDGSVDVDDLSSEGLSPGKVLVYRQGSKAPEMMSNITMPNDFNEEENKLINEFVIISGVSDVSSSSSNAAVSSGKALEILVEQDNSRLMSSAEEIRKSFISISKHILRLYAQFMAGVKVIKYKDFLNKTKIYFADRGAVDSDDVYLENENELLYTNSQRKEIILKLYDSGLLNDSEGKLRPATKEKVLALIGYKDLDYRKGLSSLQEEKAQNENEKIKKTEVHVETIDDDAIHIDEHTRYVLSEYDSLSETQKSRFYTHIEEHKTKIKNEENLKNGTTQQ